VNYRHAFHAGNFADVHKHVVLLALLERLQRKPKPILYLDTHAGRGLYDLQSLEASRGDEWRNGIGRLLAADSPLEDVRRYLTTISSFAAGDSARYPGSPLLALTQLREADRAAFVEQQPQEAYALEQEVQRRRGVSVICGDGYAALKTYLPPRENRGLVLIDPPFEADQEFAKVEQALRFGLKRWPTGVFCAWYPIKAGQERARLHDALKRSELRKLLILELAMRPSDSPLGLNGSGLIVANPPWQFDVEMQNVMSELERLLATQAPGESRVEWLAGE
jgi:23S rRNA (adenine2030-N6)-methyltransferase